VTPRRGGTRTVPRLMRSTSGTLVCGLWRRTTTPTPTRGASGYSREYMRAPSGLLSLTRVGALHAGAGTQLVNVDTRPANRACASATIASLILGLTEQW